MKAKEAGSHRSSQIHVSPDDSFDIAQPVFIHLSIPINAFILMTVDDVKTSTDLKISILLSANKYISNP